MPKQKKMNFTKIIIFTNPDHSGPATHFGGLAEKCNIKIKRPYVVFELKKFDTFWCRKDGPAGARAEYFYKWSKGHFVVLNNKEYAPYNIKYFSTKEDVEKYYKSLENRDKNRFYTYYPYDNVGYQKGYSNIV